MVTELDIIECVNCGGPTTRDEPLCRDCEHDIDREIEYMEAEAEMDTRRDLEKLAEWGLVKKISEDRYTLTDLGVQVVQHMHLIDNALDTINRTWPPAELKRAPRRSKKH